MAKRPSKKQSGGLTYADAGVDLETYDSFISGLGSMVRRTHGPRVIQNPGGFAGLFRLDYNQRLFQQNYVDPVLVALTAWARSSRSRPRRVITPRLVSSSWG